MCFSAPASFISATILGTIGVLTLKQAPNRASYILASFPLFFGIQQLIEGIMWLYLSGVLFDSAPSCLSYMFLFYADVLWPILVPLSVFLIEPHNIRKKIILPFLLIGLGVSIHLFYVINTGIITSEIQGHNIRYHLFNANIFEYIKWIYLFVVTTPFLLSSYKWVVIFGVGVIAAFILTDYFAKETYISVWCFCAAALSSILYLHFRQQKKL